MHDYVLNVLSSVVYGKNKFQEFYIFTGIGSNGKSILQKLMKYAFGGYSQKINSTVVTKPAAKANETSELYNAKGKRYLYFEEPPANDKMIGSTLKDLSGDNGLTTRGLYKEAIEWKVQFKLFGSSNGIPDLDACDDDARAMLRRLRIIDFPMTFIEDPDNPKPDEVHLPHKRKKDINLGTRIEEDIRYRQAFIKILIKNWLKIKDFESLKTPDEVMIAAKNYIESSDPVLMFINNNYNYGPSVSQEKSIKGGLLYALFLQSTGLSKKEFTQTKFGRKLSSMGIKTCVRNEKRLGIEKKPETEETEVETL